MKKTTRKKVGIKKLPLQLPMMEKGNGSTCSRRTHAITILFLVIEEQ